MSPMVSFGHDLYSSGLSVCVFLPAKHAWSIKESIQLTDLINNLKGYLCVHVCTALYICIYIFLRRPCPQGQVDCSQGMIFCHIKIIYLMVLIFITKLFILSCTTIELSLSPLPLLPPLTSQPAPLPLIII